MYDARAARYHQQAALWMLMLALSACVAPPNSLPSHSPPVDHSGAEEFDTPEQAVTALVNADRHNDKDALLRILGPAGARLISSGDPVADREGRGRFVEAYDRSNSFENNDQGERILVVGDEEWPLPIPLMHVAKGNKEVWQFDTKAGEEEILNRRVGRNEITVIHICRAYVEAQREYAAQSRAPDGQPEYAQHFVSAKGARDGLYWPVKAGEPSSPYGPLIANAQAEGYDAGNRHKRQQQYHGYFYKILKQQGANAAGGVHNYVVDGHMTGGFAMLAFPATYGDSGIMTFIVDQNGIVFEKDLGPETAQIAKWIYSYDPDESWSVVTDP